LQLDAVQGTNGSPARTVPTAGAGPSQRPCSDKHAAPVPGNSAVVKTASAWAAGAFCYNVHTYTSIAAGAGPCPTINRRQPAPLKARSVRLSAFIRENIEVILQEWEDFAETLHPLVGSNRQKLRDHAQQMLVVICADLDTYQGEQQGIEKSKGLGPDEANDTAAESHAVDRLASGFSIEELMAEYRAMRASVLRLWQKKVRDANEVAVRDMLRFNEAIDQSLTESVARYSELTRETQNVFLAILGHDVRNPLGAIGMGAQVLLLDTELSSKYQHIATRIASSARRVNEIVNDLIDFSTSNLGGGMPIKPAPMDFGPECTHIVEEIRAFHPQREVKLELAGDLNVTWDRVRINQALSNLVANATQHGAQDQPVWVSVQGFDDITLTIQNMGAPMEPSHLRTLFDPAKRIAVRSASARAGDDADHLGLGLYITRDIITAHGGAIRVSSTLAEGTTFTLTLPREAQPR
jgi:signal transduction histidine kinase